MRDPIAGFTLEEYAGIVSGVMFEARNALCASVGFGELALEKLEPSHPAFEFVKKSHEAAVRANDVVQGFSREFYRRQATEQNKNIGES